MKHSHKVSTTTLKCYWFDVKTKNIGKTTQNTIRSASAKRTACRGAASKTLGYVWRGYVRTARELWLSCGLTGMQCCLFYLTTRVRDESLLDFICWLFNLDYRVSSPLSCIFMCRHLTLFHKTRALQPSQLNELNISTVVLWARHKHQYANIHTVIMLACWYQAGIMFTMLV